MKQKHYIYILKCADDTLYTGYAKDPYRRLEEHNNSTKGAKYTRSRRPCELVYIEEFETRSDATKREAAIKKLSKKEKLDLIKEFKGLNE